MINRKRSLISLAAAYSLFGASLLPVTSARASGINNWLASQTTETTYLPIDFFTQNCAGTPVEVTGNAKMTTYTVIDSSGGYHVLINTSYNGLPGVNPQTGIRNYTLTGTDLYVLNVAPSQFPTATTTVTALRYKGVNGNQDFGVLIYTNLVLTENGITSDISNVQTTCHD